jgi:uroporphyrinogen decarboxylase
MTPRQRWLAILGGREPDRLPTDYWCTSEFHIKLVRAVGCEGEALYRKLEIDRPRHFAAPALRHHHEDDPKADLWGIRRTCISYGAGEYEEVDHHPFGNAASPADVHAFRWPSPDDFDYSALTTALNDDDGYRLIRCGTYEPFLLYCAIRGMERAYEDLILSPEIADAILGNIFDFYYEHNRRMWQAGGGKIDLFYLAEDLGGQHGPLISVDVYRRFLLPGQKKMAELARGFNIHTFYHTDGAARAFLQDLVEVVGIEILNPLQWRCPGMDLPGLVRDFGRKVAFHGGIDNQQTLPFGTVDNVRTEVRKVAHAMEKARWICAPCHNIQAISPAENVIAMYAEASRLGVTQHA